MREDATRVMWFDRSGKALRALDAADQGSVHIPQIAPDGRRVAISRTVQGNTDVWVIDGARTTRMTFGATQDSWAIWSPDGRRMAFSSLRGGTLDLYQTSASGAGSEELLLQLPESQAPNSWSRDGRFLLYGESNPKTRLDLAVLPMEGDRKPQPFLNSPFNERQGQFSPDGRWVAYQSDESGRYEIYIRPFPGPGGQWQVSTAGGISPRWRGDGKELYYISPDARLMAAPITTKGDTVEPGLPIALFQTHIVYGGAGQPGVGQNWEYDASADGRFLINVNTEDATSSPIVVIQNWSPKS